jgi:hypothetical protein
MKAARPIYSGRAFYWVAIPSLFPGPNFNRAGEERWDGNQNKEVSQIRWKSDEQLPV